MHVIIIVEVNIIWGSHQMHHSSEDYNLTTALRQSPFQKWFSLVRISKIHLCKLNSKKSSGEPVLAIVSYQFRRTIGDHSFILSFIGINSSTFQIKFFMFNRSTHSLL